jgi:ribosomal protein S18 acetylase RimI-like enzyme
MQVVPMKQHDFDTYLQESIVEYAREHVKGGRWTEEESLEQSAKEFDDLLPEGVGTKDQYLYTLEDNEELVGYFWFAVRERNGIKSAFVYEIRILDQFQRRGYGMQTFRWMEEKARKMGISSISLHVFGHNHPARQMYQKLGYEETNVMMRKTLAE